MPYANINGFNLYYEAHGAGEPIVLLPGFGTGLWSWFRQIPALARQFQVIAFDPRGISRSEASPQAFTIQDLAADVAVLLRALQITQAHIVGASFGGFMAQEFALAYPQMTRRLVLCCTSFGGVHHVPPPLEILQAMASTKGLNTQERVAENLLLAFSPHYVAENHALVQQVITLRAANFVPEAVYLQQLQAAMSFSAEDRVNSIAAPTLIITGDADTIVPAQNSRNLAAKMPHAQFVTIAGGSHWFFVEQADEFNRIVSEFLSK